MKEKQLFRSDLQFVEIVHQLSDAMLRYYGYNYHSRKCSYFYQLTLHQFEVWHDDRRVFVGVLVTVLSIVQFHGD
jgi:hypothetical protein